MIRSFAFILAILFVLPLSLDAFAESCPQALAPTEAAIANLREMYTRGQLTVQDLIAIRDGKNPLETKHGVDARTFRDVIAGTVVQLKRDSKARIKFDELIRESEGESQQQTVRSVETRQEFLPMMVFEIPQQSKHIYVANTPVTQWQYALVMHRNPSHFQGGPEERKVTIDGETISMRPNNPVESMRKQGALDFLKVLNAWSEDDNPRIYEIIANHI